MLSPVISAQAQQAPCTVVANVETLLMPNPLQPLPSGGNYVPMPLEVPNRRLPPQAFIAQDGFFHHVPIGAVDADDGPRRIVLVETLDEDWSKVFGRVQISPRELTAILSAARPQDSFALLLVGGPRVEIPFGSSRDALRAGIEALSHPDPHGPQGPDLFGGLLEATSWFGSPQIGDSILELGDIRRWRWDKAKASRLRTVLISRGIRLFSLGGAYSTVGGSDDLRGGWENPMATLCEQTGGGWQSIGYLGSGPDALDAMLWEWQNAAKALYEMATFAYALHLARTGPHVKIQLTKTVHNILSYPTPLPVCPPPSPAASAKR